MPKCDFCGKEAFVAGWLCQSEAQAAGCKTAPFTFTPHDSLEIARAALQRIVDMCPATCDMSVAHSMAEEAEHALARMGGGQ